MRNKSLPFTLIAAATLAGCGAVSIYGVPIGTPARTQLTNASKYFGTEVRDERSLAEYISLIKSVEGRVVNDDYGTYYHRVVGGYVAQFYISKSLEDSFRNSFSKSQAFMYPLYRPYSITGLPVGQCGSQWKYDVASSKKWISKLGNSKINVLPIQNTDQFASLNQQYLSSLLAGKVMPEGEQTLKFKSAIGAATLFITDGTNESFLSGATASKTEDGREVRSCSSSNVYTHPTGFKLAFFDTGAVTQAKSQHAHGVVSANSSVHNWSGEFANGRRAYIDFPKVEKIRMDLEDTAYSFCNEAIDALKLTRRVESNTLK
jgi:hypothetical protein